MLQDCLLLLARPLQAGRVTVQQALHSERVAAINRQELQQVLINLLRNALDALRLDRPAEPLIEVELQADGPRAELRVADNGPGITPQTEARLFLPFSSTKPNGMGLGLSICRSLIEMHQGRLWFSRRDTGGCCFHFALPVMAATTQPTLEKTT